MDSQESSATPQFKSTNFRVLSLLHGPTLTSIHNNWKNHTFDYTGICQQINISIFNMLCRLVIVYLPRSENLWISWLWSPCVAILEPKKVKSVTVSIVSSSICHEVIGPDAMILVFWMLGFKPAFSLFSFTFIKRPFSSSSLSAMLLSHFSCVQLCVTP